MDEVLLICGVHVQEGLLQPLLVIYMVLILVASVVAGGTCNGTAVHLQHLFSNKYLIVPLMNCITPSTCLPVS